MAIQIIVHSVIVTFFIIFDLLPIFHNKQWKAFWFYVILMSFSYIIHTLILLGIKIPSPAVPIKMLVSYIFRLQD